jgi:hypothetical protein
MVMTIWGCLWLVWYARLGLVVTKVVSVKKYTRPGLGFEPKATRPEGPS